MARALPEPGEVIAGKYLVTSFIGRGGMGAVYVVEHQLTKKRLAVKCLLPEHAEHPELVERFMREAQAAGRVHHRYIVNVFDVGREGDLFYLVMELVEGKLLSELLHDRTLPFEQLLVILMRAMEGVAAAHAQGVVHRDLKPDNILVCTGATGKLDEPRVLDFGISKLEEDATLPLTRSGLMMGTPSYMSFEQMNSQRDLDQRVDVYAMGVILYEALSGRTPYVAESVGALAIRMVSAPPDPLSSMRPDLAPELVQVVERAIARERDERYPSMQALIDALNAFLPADLLGSTAALESRTPRAVATHAALRLDGSDRDFAPSTQTRKETPLRVDVDEDSPRKAQPEQTLPFGKMALVAAGTLALLALFVPMLRGSRAGGDAPDLPAAAPQPYQRTAKQAPSKVTAPAVEARAKTASAAAPNTVAPVAEALPSSAEPLAERAADARAARNKREKKEPLALEEMVPKAPLVPEAERALIDAERRARNAPKPVDGAVVDKPATPDKQPLNPLQPAKLTGPEALPSRPPVEGAQAPSGNAPAAPNGESVTPKGEAAPPAEAEAPVEPIPAPPPAEAPPAPGE